MLELSDNFNNQFDLTYEKNFNAFTSIHILWM